MRRGRKKPLPAYRLHRPSGQAVVTLNDHDHYLGKHGTKASRQTYDRLIAEWLSNDRSLPEDYDSAITVAELIATWWRYACGYYVKNGRPTVELAKIKAAMRPLKRLYRRTSACEFGPLKLKSVRQAFLDDDLSRRHINDQVGRIKRMFKWAVENELVQPHVYHGLQAVSGLKRGRSEARETDPVRPVPDEHVDAIRPHVSPQVWAVIELQRLAGTYSLTRRSPTSATSGGCRSSSAATA